MAVTNGSAAGSSRHFTAREREIVSLVVAGLSDKEIARHLDVSDGTIRVQLHAIYRKAGVANRTALAAAVHRARLGGQQTTDIEKEATPLMRRVVSRCLLIVGHVEAICARTFSPDSMDWIVFVPV